MASNDCVIDPRKGPLIVKPYDGADPLGAELQVRRAQACNVSLDDIEFAEGLAITRYMEIEMPALAKPCGCRIAENGLIDPSMCSACHLTCPLPALARWCDQTTAFIHGGGHLIFFSGWARPGIMNLTGRYPKVGYFKQFFSRCTKRTIHHGSRFEIRRRYDDIVEEEVLDLIPIPYIVKGAGKKWTRVFDGYPDDTRIGSHEYIFYPRDDCPVTSTIHAKDLPAAAVRWPAEPIESEEATFEEVALAMRDGGASI